MPPFILDRRVLKNHVINFFSLRYKSEVTAQDSYSTIKQKQKEVELEKRK
tara:strand:- start:298 stop:447 length:150 start_codon:yes stop_codon:yes gene_type:complete